MNLHLVTAEPAAEQPPQRETHVYYDRAEVPPDALAAWDALASALIPLRPTFASSYTMAGKLAEAPDLLEAAALAALTAAQAIRRIAQRKALEQACAELRRSGL